MAKIKLNADTSMGVGVGIGTVQIVAIAKYLPGRLWPVFGNIVIGGLALAAGIYKWKTGVNHYIAMAYGFTTLLGGLATGIMDAAGWAARARGLGVRGYGQPLTDQQRMQRHNALYGTTNLPPRGTGLNGYLTNQYYPGVQGKFYRRPQSRARGFASDVTINPMAAIPTTIPYGHIIA